MKESKGGKWSLLVIDDDPDICMVLRDLLEHEGYRIRTVQSGSEALALIDHDRFDAVILNLGLPDLDGRSVLQHTKKLVPGMPVIVLSGSIRKETIDSILQAGAFAFLTKPYTRDVLKTTIVDAMLAIGVDHD